MSHYSSIPRTMTSCGMAYRRSVISAGIFMLIFLCASSVFAREIVDMRGRKVSIPDTITRVYSSSPPVTFMITAIDPTLLVGLNFPLNDGAKPYLSESLHALPVLGGFFGLDYTANIEMVLKAKPDVIITGGFKNTPMHEKQEKSLKTLGIPVVYVTFETLPEYSDALLFLGKILNKDERARKLAAYCKDVLREVNSKVSAIPPGKRPSVYYAENSDGLSTECTGSPHVELVEIAGAYNVRRCKPKSQIGMERISLEQVILYNPDIIIVKEREFFNKVFTDPGWKQIKAVKTKRIYLTPSIPFNWFDRPPSFMRFIGIKWLMGCLYPKEYRKDVVKEAQGFYRTFLGVNPSATEIKKIMFP